MSKIDLKKNFNDASIYCKSHGMSLAKLETKSEHDDLIFTFRQSVSLPDRAYVGISLYSAPYSVTYFPGQPSGDGTCLEVLREAGHTGINDLACTHMRHFICEKIGKFLKLSSCTYIQALSIVGL